MLVANFNKFGLASEVINLREVASLRDPKDDEVLINILTFPINPADLLTLQGKYATKPSLPNTLGAEAIGRVKKIGKLVENLKEGDIVMPLCRNNWVTEKLVLKNNLIKLPCDINLDQASMLKVNPATAYLMLNNYIKLSEGDYLVQNAANSSVGQIIINLANLYGIKTINIVRRKKLIKELEKKGAYETILDQDLEQIKDINPKKKTIGIDAIGGKKTCKLANALNESSTIINYGLLSGNNVEVTSHQIIFKNITLKGFWLTLWLNKLSIEEKIKLYNHLALLIKKKVITVDIAKKYDIKNLKQAINESENYKRDGKILVTNLE